MAAFSPSHGRGSRGLQRTVRADAGAPAAPRTSGEAPAGRGSQAAKTVLGEKSALPVAIRCLSSDDREKASQTGRSLQGKICPQWYLKELV